MSIGQTLASARADAGMSVEQVASATRLRRTLVEAIEADDFAALGGDFYARGHIRNYATAVGIDPAPLLAEYDGSRTPAPAHRPTEVFEAETSKRSERRGPNWSAAMAAVLVLVVIYGIAQAVVGASDDPRDQAGPTPSVTKTTGKPAPTTKAPATPNPSAVARAPRDRVTVTVRAKDRSWVQVSTGSGKELYQGLLEAGDVETFTDQARLRLVIGNAGAVTLTVNGTKVGSPGRPGQVARVQFTPQDSTG